MNKINKYILAGMVALGMTACANLDLNPLSEGSSENWYHDETEIEMALNDLWRPDFFPIDVIYWDDDLLNRNGSNEVTLGTVTSQWGTSSTRRSSLYKSIARATKVIPALDNGSATGISESKVNQYKGEAYFMLGFAYCELTAYYGDCVLNKGMTLDEAYVATRSPKSEVLTYAFECLDKAAEYLPNSYKGQQRPTKGAALGFKARFALFHEDWQTAVDAAQKCMDLGVYKLHDNYREMFQATSSPEFMFYFKGDLTLKKGYGFMENVRDFVIRKIGGHCNQSPSLELFCSYTCTDGLPIDKSPLYNPKDPFANRDPRLAMTIQPFKTKYSADYAEYEQSKKDGTFPEKYPDYITLGYEFNPSPYANTVYEVSTGKMVVNTDSKASNQHSAYNGLILRKFVKDDWKDFNNYNLKADNCYPYLRYAEVLMTYVEAKNEMGQCTQDDLDKTINQIRERAYRETGIAYPRVEVQSQEALRKIIRMDRRSEFAFEGLRYRDLLRWRIAEKSHNKSMYYLNRAWSNSANWNGLTGSESNIELSQDFMTLLKNWDEGNYPIGGIPTIDENGLPDLSPMETAGYITTFYKMSFDPKKNYLWPIPANDILVNDNLTQNDGY
ncbi:RagB/SusD family nutrient uptake outer membrane protein [Parabacteroides johnsonii]|uniref:RagB/SusD family nutrient uptake outer membrane protein n=1 Tax=Parabacteroides johnsonii TaxID=387661 RepID=UPI00242B612A|nr:RagB/SusD family nutrient uptake outer membrane protein [Parabacteroides johnsonii]